MGQKGEGESETETQICVQTGRGHATPGRNSPTGTPHVRLHCLMEWVSEADTGERRKMMLHTFLSLSLKHLKERVKERKDNICVFPGGCCVTLGVHDDFNCFY